MSLITSDSASILQENSYDAWGRRRDASTWSGTAASGLFPRGYTGHEHIDCFGLVNMNGRMYDPLLGRMLSPDNGIQAPDITESYNRYTYCFNNPLKFTDPSGWVAAPSNGPNDKFVDPNKDLRNPDPESRDIIDGGIPAGGGPVMGDPDLESFTPVYDPNNYTAQSLPPPMMDDMTSADVISLSPADIDWSDGVPTSGYNDYMGEQSNSPSFAGDGLGGIQGGFDPTGGWGEGSIGSGGVGITGGSSGNAGVSNTAQNSNVQNATNYNIGKEGYGSFTSAPINIRPGQSVFWFNNNYEYDRFQLVNTANGNIFYDSNNSTPKFTAGSHIGQYLHTHKIFPLGTHPNGATVSGYKNGWGSLPIPATDLIGSPINQVQLIITAPEPQSRWGYDFIFSTPSTPSMPKFIR